LKARPQQKKRLAAASWAAWVADANSISTTNGQPAIAGGDEWVA
jgi:hypothetical protein